MSTAKARLLTSGSASQAMRSFGRRRRSRSSSGHAVLACATSSTIDHLSLSLHLLQPVRRCGSCAWASANAANHCCTTGSALGPVRRRRRRSNSRGTHTEPRASKNSPTGANVSSVRTASDPMWTDGRTSLTAPICRSARWTPGRLHRRKIGRGHGAGHPRQSTSPSARSPARSRWMGSTRP